MPKRKRGSIGYRRPKKKKVEGAETVEEEPEDSEEEEEAEEEAAPRPEPSAPSVPAPAPAELVSHAPHPLVIMEQLLDAELCTRRASCACSGHGVFSRVPLSNSHRTGRLPARQRDLFGAHKRLITHRETILTGEHCEHHPQRDLHDGEVLELLCREIGLANALQWVPLQVLREDLDEDSLTSTPTSDAPPFLLLACLVGA